MTTGQDYRYQSDNLFGAGKASTGGGCGSYHPMACNMTLRDYLAAKAMMVSIEGSRCRAGFVEEESYPQLAEHAYKIADAMLEARSK